MNQAGGSTGPAGPKGLTRREALILLGVGALVAEQALSDGPSFGSTAGAALASVPDATPIPGGYAPDGAAGRAAALPLGDVELLASPFLDNQGRNTAYLLFLDPDRMLRPFRLNYGLPSSAVPCRNSRPKISPKALRRSIKTATTIPAVCSRAAAA